MSLKRFALGTVIGLTALVGGATGINYSYLHNETHEVGRDKCYSKIDGPAGSTTLCKRDDGLISVIRVSSFGFYRLYGADN